EWRPFPDYFPEATGSHPQGRGIFPLDIDMAEAGPVVSSLVRPPLPTTRGGHDTGDVLSGGRALVGRLLLALENTDAIIWTGAALDGLDMSDGRVSAATVDHGGHRRRITISRGVVLAA